MQSHFLLAVLGPFFWNYHNNRQALVFFFFNSEKCLKRCCFFVLKIVFIPLHYWLVQIFNVTNLPNSFESHGGEWTYVWKAISLNVKLSFTPSDVSSSPAFSNVSILNMNHLSFTPTLFPFPSLFLSLPICLLSCKTLWSSPLICAWHVPFIFFFFNSQ